ncbi:MAG: hypothetical protein WC781_01375 [Candidatus Pacearchaeota archaeon]|jgi:uncharacterized membrane protein (UPF0127 family)
MKIKIKLKDKEISLEAIEAGIFQRFRGLMFRNKEKAPILLFNMKKQYAIHSFFVFFDFITLWLDNKNRVLEWKIVKPFSPYEKSNAEFYKIIEIPINRRYHSLVTFIVGERFKKTNRL